MYSDILSSSLHIDTAIYLNWLWNSPVIDQQHHIQDQRKRGRVNPYLYFIPCKDEKRWRRVEISPSWTTREKKSIRRCIVFVSVVQTRILTLSHYIWGDISTYADCELWCLCGFDGVLILTLSLCLGISAKQDKIHCMHKTTYIAQNEVNSHVFRRYS